MTWRCLLPFMGEGDAKAVWGSGPPRTLVQRLMQLECIGLEEKERVRDAFILAITAWSDVSEGVNLQDRGAIARAVPEVWSLPTEEFWLLTATGSGAMTGRIRLATGETSMVAASVQTIFRHVLGQNAACFALVHNHPSGDCTPSRPDRDITAVVARTAQAMNIGFIDHVVVAGANYFSIGEMRGGNALT